MEITIQHIVGHWESRPMPLFPYNGDTLVIHANEFLTLWKKSEPESQTFAEGKFTILPIEHDRFSINIDGFAVKPEFKELNCRMYIPQKPASFIANIPDVGEVYFEKVN